MSLFFVYLFLTLPKMIPFFFGLSGVGLLACFISAMNLGLDYNHPQNPLTVGWWRKMAIATIACFFLGTVTPNKNDAAILAGAYVVFSVVENPEVQKTSGKIMDLINSKLDEALADVQGNVEAKVREKIDGALATDAPQGDTR